MKTNFKPTKLLALVIVFTFVLGTVLLFSPPQEAHAVTTHYYVSTSGNDNNNGSQSAPFRTIGKAALVVTPGSIVHVAPGIYEEELNFTIDGTATERIKFISDVRWGAIIQNYNKKTIGITAEYMDFEGFTVRGDATHGITVRRSFTRVANCHIYGFAQLEEQQTNNGGAGIVAYNVDYDMNDVDIVGNVIHDIGLGNTKYIHGIYSSVLKVRVVNNIVYNCSGYGIHAWHAADENVFANNLVYNNKTGGIVVGAEHEKDGKKVVANNFKVTNNIIMNNLGYAIVESGDTGTGNKYKNNLIYNNTYGILLKNGLQAENTITANPQVYRAATDGTGDFHLAYFSPAINAGTDYHVVETDFDGIPRPVGGAYDIGPYEYVPTSTLSNMNFDIQKQIGTEIPYWSKRDTTTGISLASDRSYSGAFSAKIVDSSSSTSSGLESNIFYTKPGDIITASAKAYLVSGVASINIRFYSSSGSLLNTVYTDLSSPTGQWTTVSVTGTAPANTAYSTVYLYTSVANVGSVYFDDVSAVWVVENPGFENGTSLPGWTKQGLTGGISATTEKKYAGSYSAKLVDNSSTTSCGLLSDYINAVQGETYTATAKTWITSGIASLYLYYYNSNNQLISFAYDHKTAPIGEWFTLSCTGTAPAGTKYVAVKCYSGDSTQGTAYYDSITLTKQ